MPSIVDTYRELGSTLDSRADIREFYERRVAKKSRVLDVGGQNHSSKSANRLRYLGAGADTEIVATDVIPDYQPDLIDDITQTSIPPESFEGVYCDAVLEHVTEYWAAMRNIHAILRPGGEAFVYVPFFFKFHDAMDYHRFTITEVARMVHDFSEAKVFLPGRGGGWGWVVCDTLSYGAITRYPAVHERVAALFNRVLEGVVRVWYRRKAREYTADQAVFFTVHLNYNHGFCAWVRK
jgi:hypothetical protein